MGVSLAILTASSSVLKLAARLQRNHEFCELRHTRRGPKQVTLAESIYFGNAFAISS